MTRTEQVRAIFHELRRGVGDRASAREVLLCAYALADLLSTDAEPRFDDRVPPLPFENWALDVAFADGGWRVFWHEIGRRTGLASEEWEGFDDDDTIEPIRVEIHA